MALFKTATGTLPESVEKLDLGYVGRKLLDDDAFEAQRRNGEMLWDEERVARALHEYKQFLALMYWYPEAVLIPSPDIDDVWHTHVLHTARYQSDCETMFGHFQHHVPTSGEAEEMHDAPTNDREETLQLFEEAFGEVPQSYTVDTSDRCRRMTVDDRCRRVALEERCRRESANARCRRVSVPS